MVEWSRLAAWWLCSSTPSARTEPTRLRSSMRGRPWCSTAAHTVSQDTPYSSATEATERHSWPTLAGDLPAGPGGEDLASGDTRDLLGPGLLYAPLRPAPPSALLDDESAGSAEAVQIPEVDLDTVLRLGPLPARRARRLLPGRLDTNQELAGHVFCAQDHQSGKSKDLLRQPDT